MQKNSWVLFSLSAILAGAGSLGSYFLKVYFWQSFLPPVAASIEEYLLFYNSFFIKIALLLALGTSVLAILGLVGVFLKIFSKEISFFSIAGLISGIFSMLMFFLANLGELSIYQAAMRNIKFLNEVLIKINAANRANFSDLLFGAALIMFLIFCFAWGLLLFKNKNFWLGAAGWLMLFLLLIFGINYGFFILKNEIILKSGKLVEIIFNGAIFIFLGLGLLDKGEKTFSENLPSENPKESVIAIKVSPKKKEETSPEI